MGNSSSGLDGIGIASIVIGSLAFVGSLIAVAFIVKRSSPVSGLPGLTENSFLSKTSEVGVTLLVSYLPLALLWLGPMLSVLLLKSYFMIPTFGCIITFFLVGVSEKLIFDVGNTTLGLNK